jgi:agmatinase
MSKAEHRPVNWEQHFLGEELSLSENDAKQALFHVIPCGLEKTVSYGSGTKDGPQAIIEASHQLERYLEGAEPCQLGIFTAPEIDCSGTISSCLNRLQKAVEAAANAKHIPVILGGEHSLTYAAVKGVQSAYPQPIGLIQIDAHADLRQAYQGEPHSHASVMNLLVNEGIPLFQLGVRALCQEEVDRRSQHKIAYLDGPDLARGKQSKIHLPENFPKQIYVSFDVDGLDPAIMAATGTPVPGGLDFYQALDLLASATKGRQIVGMDIVELAPHPAHMHCNFTAASLTYHLMHLASQRRLV